MEGMRTMDQSTTYLLPPPRFLQHGELPPIVAPPMRGGAPFGGPLPEQLEPFASESRSRHLTDELSERVRALVLEHNQVQDLRGKRYVWIGISVLDDKPVRRGPAEEPSPVGLLAVLYSYTDNVAIEVRLDAAGREISDVARVAYQPPPIEEEIRRAIDMARADPRLAEQITSDLEGSAILVSPADPRAVNYNHRQFDVRFACPGEPLPRFMAMVDLSHERVVSVGSCCPDTLTSGGGAD
jgi:hypothetical protein